MNPRGRPHLKQRRTVREENFGVRFAFAISDFFAMKGALYSGATLPGREIPVGISCGPLCPEGCL